MSSTISIGIYRLETEEGRQLLQAAQVIIGRDVMSRREFLVYGRKALQRVAAGGKQPRAVLYVDLDQDIDELEYLCAACQTLKRGHEYVPS